MIIIMRFGENFVLRPIYMDIYKFQGWVGVTSFTLHFLFIIRKNGKLQEHDIY